MLETMGEIEIPEKVITETGADQNIEPEVGSTETNADLAERQEKLPDATLSPEAEKAFDQLAALSKDEIDQMLIQVMQEESETSAIMEANKIREQLGLERQAQQQEDSEEREKFIAEQKDKLAAQVDSLERQALEVPESLGDGIEEAFQLRVEKMVRTPNMTEEEFNLELEESRKELIESYIEEATEHFLKEFKPKYEDAENQENVIKLIKIKVANFIRRETLEFVKFGGDPALALEGELKYSEFKTINGEKKKLVTEFNLKKEVSLPTDAEILDINKDDQEEIEEAKERDDLEEDESTT